MSANPNIDERAEKVLTAIIETYVEIVKTLFFPF